MLLTLITLDGATISLQTLLKNRTKINIVDDGYPALIQRYILYLLFYIVNVFTDFVHDFSIINLMVMVVYIVIIALNKILIRGLLIDRIYEDLSSSCKKLVYHNIRTIILNYLNDGTFIVTHDDLKKLYTTVLECEILKILWVIALTLIQNRVYDTIGYTPKRISKDEIIRDYKTKGISSVLNSRHKVVKIINMLYYDHDCLNTLGNKLRSWSKNVMDAILIAYAYYNIQTVINYYCDASVNIGSCIILRTLLSVLVYTNTIFYNGNHLISLYLPLVTFASVELSTVYLLISMFVDKAYTVDIIVSDIYNLVITNIITIFKVNCGILLLMFKISFEINVILMIFLIIKCTIYKFYNTTQSMDAVADEYLVEMSPKGDDEWSINESYLDNKTVDTEDEDYFLVN